MPLPDPAEFDGPFLDVPLRDYPEVLAALLRAFAPDSDVAYCLLARPPGRAESDDVPDPKTVWPEIRDAFVPTWTRWRNEGVRRRWHHVALPEHTDVLATLAELTVSGVGSTFVHTIALAREKEWTLVAIPHHSSVRVGAALLEAASEVVDRAESDDEQ